jgi:uncharacterized membrane protein YphA (DoxX/SURF4 family)
MAAAVILRIALAAGFLSAVADRFGLWGAAGERGVAWGNFAAFTAYTGRLNFFVPAAAVPFLAWTATALEIALAVALLVGYRLRDTAFASGLLLTAFAVTMTLATGIKAPLDYSVFTAAAGAFALASFAGCTGARASTTLGRDESRRPQRDPPR